MPDPVNSTNSSPVVQPTTSPTPSAGSVGGNQVRTPPRPVTGNSLPMPDDFYDNSIDDDYSGAKQMPDLDKERTPILLGDDDEWDMDSGNIIRKEMEQESKESSEEVDSEEVKQAAEAILSEGSKKSEKVKAKLSPKVKEFLKKQKDEIRELKEQIEQLKGATSKYTAASELSEVGDVSGALKSVLGAEKYNEFLRQELDEQMRYDNGNEYERQIIDKEREVRSALIKAALAEKRAEAYQKQFEERENNAIVQELHSAMVSARNRNDYSKFVKDKHTAAKLNEDLTDRALADIKSYCMRKGIAANEITPKIVNYFYDKNARLYQSFLVNASKARSDKIIEEKKSQAKQEAAAIVNDAEKNIQENNKMDLTNWSGSLKSLLRQVTKR